MNAEQLKVFLLAFFLGVFGVHRFYMNKPITGLLMLFTFGGFGIWWLIDVILIAVGGFGLATPSTPAPFYQHPAPMQQPPPPSNVVPPLPITHLQHVATVDLTHLPPASSHLVPPAVQQLLEAVEPIVVDAMPGPTPRYGKKEVVLPTAVLLGVNCGLRVSEPGDVDDDVFVDVETTGLDHNENYITEIAYIRSDCMGNIVASGAMLIKPPMPVSPKITQLTGITNEMLRTAPSFPMVAGHLRNVLGGATLFAHNAPFDLGFLQTEFWRAGLVFEPDTTLDTVKMARKHYPGLSNYKLGTLKEVFHIEVPGSAHRALHDALVCKAIRGACTLKRQGHPDAPVPHPRFYK